MRIKNFFDEENLFIRKLNKATKIFQCEVCMKVSIDNKDFFRMTEEIEDTIEKKDIVIIQTICPNCRNYASSALFICDKCGFEMFYQTLKCPLCGSKNMKKKYLLKM